MPSATRIIKKYPNRRLYDTEISRYITLADVRKLVMQGEDIQAVDANTREDITRGILLQIITEEENGGVPLFSTAILAKMIRFYGDSTQDLFSQYLEHSMNLFAEQQSQLQRQFSESVGKNPLDIANDLARRNLDFMQRTQEEFLEAWGLKSAAKTSGKDDDPED